MKFHQFAITLSLLVVCWFRHALTQPYAWQNQVATNSLASRGKSRPYQFSCKEPYTSWDTLTDKAYYGRQLSPARQEWVDSLPSLEAVMEIFRSTDGSRKAASRSALLFPVFANYLTEGFASTPTDEDGNPLYAKTKSNHNIDLVPLYGRTVEQTKALRTMDGSPGKKGRLKSQILNGEEFMPFLFKDGEVDPKFSAFNETTTTKMMTTLGLQRVDRSIFFAMGHIDGNFFPALVGLNAIMLREHNRIAGELESRYPTWDDERVFQTSRNILIVVFIKLVIEEYVNHITPPSAAVHRLEPGPWTWNAEWYKPNWISVEFSILHRWRALMPSTMTFAGAELPLLETLGRNDWFVDGLLTVKDMLVELSSQRASSFECFNTEMSMLQQEVEALRISRLLQLRPYADYVELWGMPRPQSFEDISGNPKVAGTLRKLYSTVNDVELYVGHMAGDHIPDGIFGQAMTYGVALDTFSAALSNPLLSEHVFNEDTFSPFGFEVVNQNHSLKDLVERNSAGLDTEAYIGFDAPVLPESALADACLKGLVDSGFNAGDTDNFHLWFNESSVLVLPETGTYKGTQGIEEYTMLFRSDFFDYAEDRGDQTTIPLSLTEGSCLVQFIFTTTAQVNASIGNPRCFKTVQAFTINYTLAPFNVHRMNVFLPRKALVPVIDALDTTGVRDFVCDVMESNCQDTWKANKLSSSDSCKRTYDSLPPTNPDGYLDGNSKGCRVVHSLLAAENDAHCPHLSFVPEEDHKGKVKCQTSAEMNPSDVFSDLELDAIKQYAIDNGFRPDELYRTCDYDLSRTFSPRSSKHSTSVKSTLTFHAFEPFVPCADGSPAGIYIEDNPKIPIKESKNHVIVFLGGGGCTNTTDCEDWYKMESFKFSTALNPVQIVGETTLSGDPTKNALHAHHKWLVPYCTMDFFLGDPSKGKSGNFTRGGSAIYDAALNHWKDHVIASRETVSGDSMRLDNVVIVGSSAGAIGTMNQVGKLRRAANDVGTRNLRIVLDSPSVMSDVPTAGKDWRQMMNLHVNFTEHPLCDPLHPLSQLYEQGSALPCCLSTHCMMRHDEDGLSSFADKDSSSIGPGRATETMLILDSAYDSFSLLTDSVASSLSDRGRELGLAGTSDLWAMVELAGQRKREHWKLLLQPSCLQYIHTLEGILPEFNGSSRHVSHTPFL